MFSPNSDGRGVGALRCWELVFFFLVRLTRVARDRPGAVQTMRGAACEKRDKTQAGAEECVEVADFGVRLTTIGHAQRGHRLLLASTA